MSKVFTKTSLINFLLASSVIFNSSLAFSCPSHDGDNASSNSSTVTTTSTTSTESNATAAVVTPVTADMLKTIIEGTDVSKLGNNNIVTKHIGATKDSLGEILKNDSKIAIVSSYNSLDEANATIKAVLNENIDKIAKWLNGNSNKKLYVTKKFDKQVGYALEKGKTETIAQNKALVILKKDNTDKNHFSITNSYPIN